MPPKRNPVERFHEKYKVLENGCWEWQAATAGQGNYGVLRLSNPRRQVYAHRFSHTIYKGPVPDGLQIDHLCRNTRCVNPDHLEAVTGRVNVLRGDTLAAKNVARTHCKNGHSWSEENTLWYKGYRSCRACHRDRQRKRQQEGKINPEKQREAMRRFDARRRAAYLGEPVPDWAALRR